MSIDSATVFLFQINFKNIDDHEYNDKYSKEKGGDYLLYQSILEQIEEGGLTVGQAIKKIEKYSKQKQKMRAKKMKLLIIDDGKQLYLPAISFSMMKYFFKLCAPFIKFSTDDKQKFNKDEIQTILTHVEEVLQLMKDYPPIDLIDIQSNKTIIKIMTK